MSYKIVTIQQRQPVFYRNIQLDRSRNTAILIRQSKRGSDAEHYEGRLLQESLIPFVQAAREEDDLEHIHIFDEGAGDQEQRVLINGGRYESSLRKSMTTSSAILS